MSENIDVGQSSATSKSTWWGRIVERLRPATPISEVVVLEDPQTIMQEDTKQLPQIEIVQTVFKPAHRIFFHTSPSQNVAGIRKTGLIGNPNKDMIGRDLGYSLTFAEEFNQRYVGRVITQQNPVADFSLIIWKSSSDIRKVKSDEGKLKPGRFGAAKRLDPDEVIPQGYWNSCGGKTGTADKLRKIDPANFLAAISINEQMQNALTRSKIEFAYNLSDANSTEERLMQFLSDNDQLLQLTDGYTIQALAHDLMVRMQQEVLVHKTRAIAVALFDSGIDYGLGEILVKLQEVNEPVSYRYLKAWERKLKQAYQEKGITWPTQRDFDQDQKQSFGIGVNIDIYGLWGGTGGSRLFWRVAQSMGISRLI